MADDLTNAGITPKERLANIEHILTIINQKLDSKADLALVLAMEGRLRAIELLDAKTDAERRVSGIERDSLGVRTEKRLNDLEMNHNALTKRVAYAAGGLSVIVVVANYLAAQYLAG